jgi:hypothetical protein
MSAQPEPEEDREQQKSKKPAGWFDFIFDFFLLLLFILDTAFKQQRLPAWQPIITANTALPVFLIIGLIFIPIGIILVVTSDRVQTFFLLKII